MKNSRVLQNLILEEQIFKYAMILSFAAHLFVFINLPRYSKNSLERSLKNIEVTYFNLKLQAQKIDSQSRKKEGQKNGGEKNTEVLIKKEAGAPSPVKEMSKLDDKFVVLNKQPAMISEVNVKRKVSVPVLKSEKINNPLYQNYYQAIRSVIKKRAYSNYSQSDTGEVYLTFVLLSDGSLKQLQIIDERTSANRYLRETSLKSIKDASPFPSFPSDLTYPELSFNVVISYEVEE